jgi:hypothetical protein
MTSLKTFPAPPSSIDIHKQDARTSLRAVMDFNKRDQPRDGVPPIPPLPAIPAEYPKTFRPSGLQPNPYRFTPVPATPPFQHLHSPIGLLPNPYRFILPVDPATPPFKRARTSYDMVGKKSAKALSREEGLERTDNGLASTSWPEVAPINQKNYYTYVLSLNR